MVSSALGSHSDGGSPSPYDLSSHTKLFVEQWEATLFSRVETTAYLWAVRWWGTGGIGLCSELLVYFGSERAIIILTSRKDITCPSLSSVNWMLWSMELMWSSISTTWSAGTAERTSSTYLFQNMVGTSDVLRARSSICSITVSYNHRAHCCSKDLLVYSPIVIKGGG